MDKDIVQEAVKNPGLVGKILKKNVELTKDIALDMQLVLKILLGSNNPEEVFEVLKDIKVPMGACGKIINAFDILWFCKSCEKTPNSSICQECYTNSNHVGHNAYFRKGYVGVCDCGDADAWKTEGFCSNHKGYNEKLITTDLLPLHIKTVVEPVMHFLAKKLNKAALDYKAYPETGFMQTETIRQIILLFEQLTNVCGIFGKLACQALDEYCFEIIPSEHVCNFRTFLCEFEEQLFPKAKQAKLLKRKAKEGKDQIAICECKVLENVLKVIHMLDQDTIKVLCNFLVKMTKSPLLKDLLGYGILSNYRSFIGEVTYERLNLEEDIDKVSLQIFTIDAMGKKFMQLEACRNSILDIMQYLIKSQINWKETQEVDLYAKFFMLRRDMKYFNRPNTMEFLVNNTDFLNKLLYIYKEMEFTPLYVPLAAHITDSTEAGYRLQSYADKFLIEIAKTFLKSFDYSNVAFCRKFGLFF